MYKTLKIPFKHVIKEKCIIEIIDDMAQRTTKIVKHIYYFIKLYTIHSFENDIYNISFDKDKIRYISTLVSSINSERDVKYEHKEIKKFYNNIFSKLNIKKISRDGLTNVIAYESDIIITCIENNIKNNFRRHFDRYINTILNVKSKIALIKDIQKKKEIFENIKKLKYDILSFDKYSNKKNFRTKLYYFTFYK